MNELAEKEKRVRALMAGAGVEALLPERENSFARYTGGASSFVRQKIRVPSVPPVPSFPPVPSP